MPISAAYTESLQTEMEHKLATEMEQTQREHHMQMQAARMELERAMELTRQKVSHSVTELVITGRGFDQ